MPVKIHSVNMDANESIFFSKQLTHIMAEAIRAQYPENNALRLFPINREGGAGAAEITYRMFDVVGMAKFIANYANDIPRVDVKGEEVTAKIKPFAVAYGYSIQEIRYAIQAGISLDAEKARAAREIMDRFINFIAWRGDSAAGVQGLLYHPNVTKGSATTGDWGNGSRTADQIIADVNNAIVAMVTTTNGIEMPKWIGMPPEGYMRASTLRVTDNSGRTALEVLKANHPGITFESIPELAALPTVPSTGAATVTDVMVLCTLSPDKFALSVPVPFEQFPPQERGLEQIVNTHGRTAGIIMKRPLSVSIVEGL